MHKWWAILFGVIMALAGLLFVVAPFIRGWWLPLNVATFGGAIDNLFYLILGITGFFFVLTEVLLVYNIYRFHAQDGQKSDYVHGSHQLEMLWTFIPGAILLFLALWQIPAWVEVKFQSQMPLPPDKNTQVMVVQARQWEWRVRYPNTRRLAAWDNGQEDPADFYRKPRPDDVWVVNEIHAWKGDLNDTTTNKGKVLVYLETRDVLHSFFLPNLRLKQDALPGKTIPVWFKAFEANTHFDTSRQQWVDGHRWDAATNSWQKDDNYIWELACAEYCGSRHSMMRGKFYVYPTKDDFLKWLAEAEKQAHATQPETE
ncbi:MAG: cytochrome c oxidase subunit II [Gemmataceae bacterium]